MSRGTIALLTGNSLCNDPRAAKSAATLARAGYRVKILGAWLDPVVKARDLALRPEQPFEFVPVLDLTQGDAIRRFVRRATGKAAQFAHDIGGRESARQLGAVARPLLAAARRHPAELYIAHSEPGLHAAYALLGDGCRVGVDMEDWFSEDLLPEARGRRPLRLLRSLEADLLRRGACSFATSEAMADALSESYACRRPTVIYNAFPWSDRHSLDDDIAERVDRPLPSLYWFSQTLGPGRGIEDLLGALPLLSGTCEIHLRGASAAGFVEWIEARLPESWRRRVFLHDLVNNAALLPRIAEHDIGFAGELTYCRNKVLTVSNKVLHYLLGGLAVLASDTDGQREVAGQAPGAVQLYRAGDPRNLACRLDELLASPARREGMKKAALSAARDAFCWERQEEKLLDAITCALRSPRHEPVIAPSRAANLTAAAR